METFRSVALGLVFFVVGNMFYITIIGMLYLIWKELRIMNNR